MYKYFFIFILFLNTSVCSASTLFDCGATSYSKVYIETENIKQLNNTGCLGSILLLSTTEKYTNHYLLDEIRRQYHLPQITQSRKFFLIYLKEHKLKCFLNVLCDVNGVPLCEVNTDSLKVPIYYSDEHKLIFTGLLKYMKQKEHKENQ